MVRNSTQPHCCKKNLEYHSREHDYNRYLHQFLGY